MKLSCSPIFDIEIPEGPLPKAVIVNYETEGNTADATGTIGSQLYLLITRDGAPIEFTLPEISQTLILTRMGGRTPVPDKENLASLARHQSAMAIYLSIALVDEVAAILANAYGHQAVCAVVYRVSQPEEKIIFTKLKDLAKKVKDEKITRQALIIVGKFLDISHANLKHKSKLYDKKFKHGHRG